MRINKKLLSGTLVAGAFTFAPTAFADTDEPVDTTTTAVEKAPSTAKLDKDDSAKLEKNAEKIKTAIKDDATLSPAADKVDVAVGDDNFNIKLTGTVRNEDDKKEVEKKANEVMGIYKVESDLKVEK